MTQLELFVTEPGPGTGKWKRYQAYKDSGVEWLGEIPEHWEAVRLKDTILACQNGIWGDEPTNDVNDIVCIRVADFDRMRNRVIDTNLTLRSIPPDQRKNRVLRRGDLLLEKSGGGELQPVGVVVLYDLDTSAVCSNFIARMPIISGVDSLFLCYLHSAFYSARLNTRSIKQNTGIQNLDSYAYLCEQAYLPPLPEQRAIAAFLDRETTKINVLVAKKERLIELLREKRTALISHAVTKGLDAGVRMKDSGVEWLGEIPEHWEVRRLKYVASILRGKFSHRPRNDPQMYDGLYPFIQTGDITATTKYITAYHQTLNELGFTVSKQFPSQTLVMAIAANIGDLAILQFPACFPDSIVGFVPAPNIVLDYLYYNLSAMKPEMISTATINTQLNLNVERISNLFTACPPFSEQKAIASYLDQETAKIDALISRIGEGIEKLKEYRTALISATVTGKVDVRETIE